MSTKLEKVYGHPVPTGIKNVTTSGTSAKVELDADSLYVCIATTDCYFQLGLTGEAATTNSMLLKANTYFWLKTGTNDKFFHAIQASSAGFVRLQKMVEIGD